MASNSKIEWTDSSWNPIVGCSKVSPGCANCYAEKMAYRLACMNNRDYEMVAHAGQWRGKTVFVESALENPLHWRKAQRIFVCSMGDLFHESVPFEWIDQVFAVMALCPQHTFQVLTKRSERMKEYISAKNRQQPPSSMEICNIRSFTTEECVNEWAQAGEWISHYRDFEWPLPNVWLGVTAENQDMADRRIPILLEIPAAVRFVSCEPLLEEINDLEYWLSPTGSETCSYGKDHIDKKCDCQHGKLDWVIVGAESGPNRRTCQPQWAVDIVDQCRAADVPCFVKQLHSIHNEKTTVIKNPDGFPREFPSTGI